MKTSKLLILLSFVLLAFTVGDSKSEYSLPRKAFSVFLTDIDLDNNIDIIVGHKTAWQDTNKTISILQNSQSGYFDIVDTSIIFSGYQENIFTAKINQDNFPDIVTFFSDFSSGIPNRFIRVFYNENGGFSQYSDFTLNSSSTFTNINYGDVSGNGFDDIVVIINNDFLWGIIYNDGTGNFSAPEYFDLNYPPLDITCADMNGDGRDDVVIDGSYTEIYYWTETGFEQQVLGYTWTSGGMLLISDFDNDGDNDILQEGTLYNNTNRIFIFENLGDNQFFEHPYFDFSPFCSYAQIADFDNDSLPDMVFVAQDNSGLFIYHNIGDFQLEYDQFIPINCTQCLLRRVACADLDNNGYNDIVAIRSSNYYLSNNLIVLYNNNGVFQDNPVTNIEHTKLDYIITCYPNPFISNVTFKLELESNSKVDISIYDIHGKEIFGLTKNMKGGTDYFNWNGFNYSNQTVRPGVYFARFVINGTILKTVKLIKY